jgi:hypothetical protein
VENKDTAALLLISAEDIELIRSEHERLHRYLTNIEDTCIHLNDNLDCSACDKEKRASCHGRLPSFLYVLHDITEKHFQHEEFIMEKRLTLGQQSNYYDKHCQAHTQILDALHQAIVESDANYEQGKIANAYKCLYDKVSHEMDTHTREFDDPFLQSVTKSNK